MRNNDVFKDLTQLAVVELHKRDDRDLDLLSPTEYVFDRLKDEDVVDFNLTSVDVWIKINLNLMCKGIEHN